MSDAGNGAATPPAPPAPSAPSAPPAPPAPPGNVQYVNSPSGFARSRLYYALIGGVDQTAPTFAFERDEYPAYELIYITKGRGQFRYGDEWRTLETGDGVVYDMRHPHAFRADAADPYEMRYVVFHGADLDKQWLTWFDGPCVWLRRSPPPGPRYASVLLRVLNEMSRGSNDREPTISALLYELLMEALAQGRAAADEQSAAPPALERGRRYLEERFADEDVDVHGAADAAGISYYHFIRQFKRYYGSPPKEYLTQLRLGEAKRLLLHTDRPVGETAEAAGFGSYNAFLHTFLQHEGCSPTHYRKTWRRRPPSD